MWLTLYWIYILTRGFFTSLLYCLLIHWVGILLHSCKSPFLSFNKCFCSWTLCFTWAESFHIVCGSQHNTKTAFPSPNYAFSQGDNLHALLHLSGMSGREQQKKSLQGSTTVPRVNQHKHSQGCGTTQTLAGRHRIGKTIFENNLALCKIVGVFFWRPTSNSVLIFTLTK